MVIITTPLLMEHILWFIINKTFYGFMDCSLLFSFSIGAVALILVS